eukprot:755854-Hanusia_phi.AAC.2
MGGVVIDVGEMRGGEQVVSTRVGKCSVLGELEGAGGAGWRGRKTRGATWKQQRTRTWQAWDGDADRPDQVELNDIGAEQRLDSVSAGIVSSSILRGDYGSFFAHHATDADVLSHSY